MTEAKNTFFFIFMFVNVVCITFVIYTIAHEQTHVAIMRYHGCNETEVSYNFFIDAYATCTGGYVERTAERRDQEYLLHSVNEIVGYHFTILLIALYGIMVLNLLSRLIKH